MKSHFKELPGLQVIVEKVINIPDLQGILRKQYRFAYFLKIINHSSERISIKGRKWVVREKNGHVTVVEGDGVVGEFPCIAPGGHFSYNSSHVVTRDAVAEGSLLGVTSQGERVIIKIPPFSLVC